MNSTGVANKIQVSATTASLLINAGLESWLKLRQDTVIAKDIGVVQTYWLDVPSTKTSPSYDSSDHSRSAWEDDDSQIKQDRLIHWVVEVLLRYVRKVVARRANMGLAADSRDKLVYEVPRGKTSLDEVVEIIKLPAFNEKTVGPESSDVSDKVVHQLHQVVAAIADRYRGNHFHNFEHACHVTMCCESE